VSCSRQGMQHNLRSRHMTCNVSVSSTCVVIA
jgi:hypothetical protein